MNHFVKKDTKKSPKVINEHIVNREVENERLRREINHIKAELIKVENDKNCEIDVLKQKCNNLKNAEIKIGNFESDLREKDRIILSLEKKLRKKDRKRLDFDEAIKEEKENEDEIIPNVPTNNSYAILAKLESEKKPRVDFYCEVCEK